MEKYNPPPRRRDVEAPHRVVGNLFMASSLKDMMGSRNIVESRHRDLVKHVVPFEARALLSLQDEIINPPTMAFVYVPSVRHRKNSREVGRMIFIRDDTTRVEIEVPEEGYDINQLRATWRKPHDVVLFSIYDEDPFRNKLSLTLFFEKPVSNPKEDLGARIIGEARQLGLGL